DIRAALARGWGWIFAVPGGAALQIFRRVLDRGRGEAGMTPVQFWSAVETLTRRYRGSVIRARATASLTFGRECVDPDPHVVGLGTDVVWDAAPPSRELEDLTRGLQLELVHCENWDHFQPADWNARKQFYLSTLKTGGGA